MHNGRSSWTPSAPRVDGMSKVCSCSRRTSPDGAVLVSDCVCVDLVTDLVRKVEDRKRALSLVAKSTWGSVANKE